MQFTTENSSDKICCTVLHPPHCSCIANLTVSKTTRGLKLFVGCAIRLERVDTGDREREVNLWPELTGTRAWKVRNSDFWALRIGFYCCCCHCEVCRGAPPGGGESECNGGRLRRRAILGILGGSGTALLILRKIYCLVDNG